jgi:V8-like Glu-specific endopeptidase
MRADRTRRGLALTLATVTLMTVTLAAGAAPADAVVRPGARPFGGIAAIGALFARGPHGALGRHFCSASVVNSPGGDLVITAAHCLDGRPASRVAFVPGYARGRKPHGVWLVRREIRDQEWDSKEDPGHDIAFLLVSRPGSKQSVQSVTGGEGLSVPQPGERVMTVGYPDGRSRPVRCANALRAFGTGQVEFDCRGYTDGTSGGPLITGTDASTGLGVIVGVIGGYQLGGDTDAVSYAAWFGHQVHRLYLRAVALAHRPARHRR